MKYKLLAAALLNATIVGGAHAGAFQMNVGSFGASFNGAGEDLDLIVGTAGNLVSLGFTDSQATSIYLFGADGTLGPGDTVIDTNKVSVMNTYNVFNKIAGTGPVPTAPTIGDTIVETFNTASDQENFSAIPDQWGTGFQATAPGDRWGLSYQYEFTGAINAGGTGVDFTSGYIDVFFEDDANAPFYEAANQVLRLNLANFTLEEGNAFFTVIASGSVTFDWDGVPGNDCTTAFCQDFFIDVASGETFWDLWNNGGAVDPLKISWRLDNNVDCANGAGGCNSVPFGDQLSVSAYSLDPLLAGTRQTTQDGTIRFEVAVPEPTSLMLIGAGLLLGAGGLSRSRKAG